MSNEIQIAQQEIIKEFQFFDNWIDRYQYLIDLGRRLPDLDESERVDANKIRGCQAQVWFVAEQVEGRLNFRAISDAVIVSGLIALLLRLYSGRHPQDILDSEPTFVTALELESHLSLKRSNGLFSMLAAIRNFATAADEAPRMNKKEQARQTVALHDFLMKMDRLEEEALAEIAAMVSTAKHKARGTAKKLYGPSSNIIERMLGTEE